MSRCKQCNVEILDETERCPLCHSVLEKTVEVENMYPNVRTMTRRLALLSRIYLFVAILVEALLIYLNVLSDSEMFWSAICHIGKIRLQGQDHRVDADRHPDGCGD